MEEQPIVVFEDEDIRFIFNMSWIPRIEKRIREAYGRFNNLGTFTEAFVFQTEIHII